MINDDKVINFLKKYPDGNIPDSDVHAFADKENIDVHKLESIFYKFAAKYANSIAENKLNKLESLIENSIRKILANKIKKK